MPSFDDIRRHPLKWIAIGALMALALPVIGVMLLAYMAALGKVLIIAAVLVCVLAAVVAFLVRREDVLHKRALASETGRAFLADLEQLVACLVTRLDLLALKGGSLTFSREYISIRDAEGRALISYPQAIIAFEMAFRKLADKHLESAQVSEIRSPELVLDLAGPLPAHRALAVEAQYLELLDEIAPRGA